MRALLLIAFFLYLPVTSGVGRPLLESVRVCLHELLGQAKIRVEWPSQFFTGEVVSSQTQARKIIEDVRSNSGVRDEIQKIIQRMGGPNLRQSPKLWSMYVHGYDHVTPYSDGYVKLIELLDSILPREGRLADFGSATATIPAMLIQRSPKRQMTLVDFSGDAMDIAKRKMDIVIRDLSPRPRVDFILGDLRKLDWNTVGPLNGFMINNLLYNFSPEEQVSVLKNMASRVEPGGVIAICELDGDVIQSGDKLIYFAERVTMSGIQNGAPITDFELALIVYINREILAGQLPTFLTAERRQFLASEAGLRIVKVFPGVYHGASTLTVFAK